MTAVGAGEQLWAISQLMAAADDFSQRAQVEEARRDLARPGTVVFHQHAHSATLWRSAEHRLRGQVRALELGPDTTGDEEP
ncbi:MAG TPA: hypothetical protein VGV65_10520 [Nocardioides sp.]|nr:hypothetical protein [Nocardioides sp.]